MSALASELRHFASILWRDADNQADPEEARRIASAWHAQALILECAPIDSIDDCTEVYGEPVDDETILTDLDRNNTCTDPGGHVWLASGGDVRCLHCPAVAMPVYASREAE